MDQEDFGKTAEAVYKKEMVLKRLDKISINIKNEKVFTHLSNLDDQCREQKHQAKQMLYPQENFNEQLVVSNWFNSDAAKEEECMKIYEKAMSVGKVSAKEFTRFVNWVRFTQAIVDKNGRSVYSFTNKDFTNRCPKWLPKTAASDITSAVDRFEDLPDDWNTDSPPEEGMEPLCWTIKVCGNWTKRGKKCTACFNSKHCGTPP